MNLVMQHNPFVGVTGGQMAAYHQKFASTAQTDPVIECTIAEAKAKVDREAKA